MPSKDLVTDELQKLQRLDHDALIRVEENLKSIAVDIKEMKDGTTRTLLEHEAKINSLQLIVDVVKPEATVKEFRVLHGEWHDFKVTANAFRLLGGVAGGIVVFVMTQVPNILRSWGILR